MPDFNQLNTHRRSVLIGLMGVSTNLPALSVGFGPSSLTTLDEVFGRAIETHAQQHEYMLILDVIPFRDTVDQLDGDRASACAAKALAATTEAEKRADAAWDHILTTETKIAEATADNLQGVMIQVQILATRHILGFLDDKILMSGVVRNLERLQQPNWGVAEDDMLANCRAWEVAMLAVTDASSDLDLIKIDQWAMGFPEWESDPVKRAAMVAERVRTGWDAALKRLWAATEHLENVEVKMSTCVATSPAALLLQARTLHRRLSEEHLPNGVNTSVALALLNGLEALGTQRTRELMLYET